MKKHLILILILSVSGLIYSSSVGYPTEIYKYRMQNGLSNDVVYDVCQDDDGCMWFATAEGISKFDGSEFTLFNWTQDMVDITNSQAIKILYNHNKLFLATPFGLVVYDMVLNSFKMALPPGVTSVKVRALAHTSDKNIWVGIYGGGVYKYDIINEKFSKIKYNPKDDRVISLYEDKQGFLYIGSHFGGMDRVNLKTGVSVNYSDMAFGMPDKQVEKIIEDSFGNIWLGTWGGLVLFDKKNQHLTTFTNLRIKNKQINTLTEDKSGNLWIGTEDGLVAFNIREFLVTPHTFNMDVYDETRDEYGLSYKTVLALHCDPENNIWIGTNSGGVNFISRFEPKFHNIIYDPRIRNSLSYRRVSSISEDETGNLWIATDGGGINFYDKTSNKITVMNKNNSNITDDAVLCSLVDSDGDVWFGTYHNTLIRRIKGEKKFIVYQHSENTILTGDVLCLVEDKYKRIWIGQRSGLVCYDKKEGKFIKIPQLEWITIKCISTTSDGLYIGTHPNVYFYDFVKRKIEIQHPVLEKLLANCLYVDKKNNLWIGTNGQGLYRYDPHTKQIAKYDLNTGFPSNNICKILEDDEQNLWITSTKGISKFSKDDRVIRNFNSKDGVQPGMFIENCGVKSTTGQIIFGGTEGITLFYPKALVRSQQAPKVIFTSFLLFNNPVEVRSRKNAKSPLLKNINYADEIILKYNESVFSIEYTSVNYLSTGQINYAYILEGVDKEWNYVKNKKMATYRYISPGTYTFKVMASDLEGNFDNSIPRTIKIYVEPPYYMTWWAYTIYFILFCFICYFVWDFVTVKTRALNRIRYERLERRKLEELHQEKLSFFTNISHELRTPLTLIAAPVDRLLTEEKSEEKKYLLSLIKRNVIRLLNNVNEIMDIRKIEHNQMKLKVKELDVVVFVGEVVELFRDLANSKQINLEYSYQKDLERVFVDPEFLDKILCNILSNAFKFTSDHGEIVVNVFKELRDNSQENRLCIEIVDTGKGIPQEHLSHIFDRFYQVASSKAESGGIGSGVGLHLVKSLVELHKGNIVVESKVGIGTRFTIDLPLSVENYLSSEKVNETTQESRFQHVEHLTNPVLPNYGHPMKIINGESRNKILIVDDDKEILNFLKFELNNDYEIIIAENGRLGLEKAYEIIPDLIVSDVMMPELDGISMCGELKSNINTSHIPVILLTAKGSVDDRIEGLEVGAESYIPKPFDIRHLRVRIKKLIELRELFQSAYVSKLVVNEAEERPRGISVIDEQLLQKLITYIKEHISDSEINGESLSELLAMSRMSLHRKLKALTGLSAGEFIRNIRLEEAKKLLEAGGMNVSEVSYDVGYSSPSYFYTCFVRKFGISPSEVIKKTDI